MESTLGHIVFFLQKWEKNFKRTLRTLRFFTQLNLQSTQKNYIIVNTIYFLKFLSNLYYIESEAFSQQN